jgi:hypothetical protein
MRGRFLVRLIAKEGELLKQAELAKEVGLDGGKVRVWMSRFHESGLLDKIAPGEYVVRDRDAIVILIEKLKRNSVTRGSTGGGRHPAVETVAQPCRLHDIQYTARLVNANVETLRGRLLDWQEVAGTPGSGHWVFDGFLGDTGISAKMHIAAGPRKATIQIWMAPIFCNGHRLKAHLDAVCSAAQVTLAWVGRQYNIHVALLEAKRSGHFAIRIPVKSGWVLGKLGYGVRAGKVWITDEWWIDASYNDELETAHEESFSALLDGLKEIKNLRREWDEYRSAHEGNGNGGVYVPPSMATGEEIA